MQKFLPIAGLLILAVYVLMSVGCNTMGGIGADLHDLAIGTQERMGQRRYTQPMPAQHVTDNGSVYHTPQYNR